MFSFTVQKLLNLMWVTHLFLLLFSVQQVSYPLLLSSFRGRVFYFCCSTEYGLGLWLLWVIEYSTNFIVSVLGLLYRRIANSFLFLWMQSSGCDSQGGIRGGSPGGELRLPADSPREYPAGSVDYLLATPVHHLECGSSAPGVPGKNQKIPALS